MNKAGSEGDWEGLGRLPLRRGRNRLSRQEIAENQRLRLIDAMAESVATRGFAATSVERVIELAGISRGTFYEHFANRRECLLAAHEEIFEVFISGAAEACAGEEDWRYKVVAVIGEAIELARRSPEQARLLAIGTIAADGESARQGLAAADRLAAMLRSGRDHYPKATQLPEVTERVLVGAVASAVNWRLVSGESLTDLEPQLVHLVLAPYVGPAVAAGVAATTGERMEQPGT